MKNNYLLKSDKIVKIHWFRPCIQDIQVDLSNIVQRILRWREVKFVQMEVENTTYHFKPLCQQQVNLAYIWILD